MAVLDQFKLDGKVAIVTGAGRGLGQAIAFGPRRGRRRYRGSGCTGSSGDQSRGRETRTALRHDQGRPVEERMRPADRRRHAGGIGHIDILFNNAGIIRRAPLTEFTEKDWDDVININLRTLFFLSQAVAKVMIKQGKGGKIINTASMLSFQGGIRVPSYTASKSAVMGLTRLMGNELAQHGINVNAIAPGYMATDNTKALREDEKRSAEILARIPAGRWGMPTDLQGAAVFLASSASDYVQAYTIAVDGGWLAR